MNTEKMGMERILLNPENGDCIAKPLAPIVLSTLKEYTSTKNNPDLGELMGIKSPQVAISQMKAGKINLRLDKLHNLAKSMGVSFKDLTRTLCERILVVSDPEKRRAFLAGLQNASGASTAALFFQKINGQEAQFLQNGIIPCKWIELIPDFHERVRIITTHCAKPIIPKKHNGQKSGTPLPRAPEKKNGEVPTQKSLSKKDNAAEGRFSDAIEGAFFLAGKATIIDSAKQAFIGELITQLHDDYEITIRIETLGDKSLSCTFKDRGGNCFDKKINLGRLCVDVDC